MTPTVSFIVPCYRLAHLLSDCIDSILAQTYQNYEVLIMDDCSPDDTPAVARSFNDSRVMHIRNEVNLGHLSNYNRGIDMARGRYIWLISADDRLRSVHVLERYVTLMEANPHVGYCFCPAVRLENGVEKELLDYSVHGDSDTLFRGTTFLERLIYANTIVAPSAMARRECYQKISMFPLDMPWGGDWYLWCMFAFHYDVGYFSEPMVCYRRHSLSMTNQLMASHVSSCSAEDVELPWIIKAEAQQLGYKSVVKHCRQAIAREYARTMTTQRYLTAKADMPFERYQQSLGEHAAGSQEERWIASRVHAEMGNYYYWQCDYAKAKDSYALAIGEDVWMLKIRMKYLLLCSGTLGITCRQLLRSLRRKSPGTIAG